MYQSKKTSTKLTKQFLKSDDTLGICLNDSQDEAYDSDQPAGGGGEQQNSQDMSIQDQSDISDEHATYVQGDAEDQTVVIGADNDEGNQDEFLYKKYKFPKPQIQERIRRACMNFVYYDREIEVETDDEEMHTLTLRWREIYKQRAEKKRQMKEGKGQEPVDESQLPPPVPMAPDAVIHGHLNPFTTPMAPQPDQGIPAGLFAPESMRRPLTSFRHEFVKPEYDLTKSENLDAPNLPMIQGEEFRPKRKYVLSGLYKRNPANSELTSEQASGTGNSQVLGYSAAMPREHALYKREIEFDLMLPFRVRRIEKMNNNGSKKQAKLEIRKRMINERVKQRQRFLSMKKLEGIKELINKGELAPDALRWKVRRFKGDDKETREQKRELLRQQGIEVKSEDLSQDEEEDQVDDDGRTRNRDGQARAVPCRWSVIEATQFVRLLKSKGKDWKGIAKDIGTKNEQQCRTRGLVLWNKIKQNNWDQELYDVLKPSGKFIRDKEATSNLELDVKAECNEEPNNSNENAISKSSFVGKNTTENPETETSQQKRREEVQRIKEQYLKRKAEKREAERLARIERKKIIDETKENLKKQREERIQRNRDAKQKKKEEVQMRRIARKRQVKEEDVEEDSEDSEEAPAEKGRQVSNGKDKVKAESKMRDEELDFLNELRKTSQTDENEGSQDESGSQKKKLGQTQNSSESIQKSPQEEADDPVLRSESEQLRQLFANSDQAQSKPSKPIGKKRTLRQRKPTVIKPTAIKQEEGCSNREQRRQQLAKKKEEENLRKALMDADEGESEEEKVLQQKKRQQLAKLKQTLAQKKQALQKAKQVDQDQVQTRSKLQVKQIKQESDEEESVSDHSLESPKRKVKTRNWRSSGSRKSTRIQNQQSKRTQGAKTNRKAEPSSEEEEESEEQESEQEQEAEQPKKQVQGSQMVQNIDPFALMNMQSLMCNQQVPNLQQQQQMQYMMMQQRGMMPMNPAMVQGMGQAPMPMMGYNPAQMQMMANMQQQQMINQHNQRQTRQKK